MFNLNNIVMKTVKSVSELKQIFNDLSNQGFGYVRNEHDFIRPRIHKMIYAANVHNLSIDPDEITRKLGLWELDVFSKMQTKINAYFKQFSSDDKLKQCIKKLSLQSSDSKHAWTDDDQRAIERYNAFFKGTGHTHEKARNDDRAGWHCLLDVSKNFLKVTYNNRRELEYVIRTVLGVDIEDFPYAITDKYELGKKHYIKDGLSLTFYQNGYVKIEHSKIEDLKKLFIEYYSDFANYVIKQ
jgi:hypothetical protein